MACLTKFLKTSTIPALFLVCTSDKLSTLPISLRSLILYHFEIPLLTEEDRKSIIIHEVDESRFVDTAAVTHLTSVGYSEFFFYKNVSFSLEFIISLVLI